MRPNAFSVVLVAALAACTAGGPAPAPAPAPVLHREAAPQGSEPAATAPAPAAAPAATAAPAASSAIPAICAKPLPLPSKIGVPAFREILDEWVEEQCWIALGWNRDQSCRNAEEVHGSFVVNYYSQGAFDWLKAGRAGAIPDGEMIVKTMWRDCRKGETPDGTCGQRCFKDVAPMYKDAEGSFDGWFWSYDDTGDDISYPFSNLGLYCLNCHASAVSESTFASPECLEPNAPENCAEPVGHQADSALAEPEAAPDESVHEIFASPRRLRAPVPPPAPAHTPEQFYAGLRSPAEVDLADVRKLPGEALDHVVSAQSGPQQFLTSDQCLGCHDATSSNSNPPNMIACVEDGKPVDCLTISDDARVYNLSPYAEAHASMMGLSGRDPVFFAQLESETVVHAPNSSTIQDTCFTCHGVMGEHQLQADRGVPFEMEMVYATGDDPLAEFGALARDGVSCTVCHHVVLADSVPFEETFTGKFFCGPPDELYGPFSDHVRVKPMEQALGITPGGEQDGIHASDVCGPKRGGGGQPIARADIGSSKVCGSCHTVYVPVFDAAGKQISSTFEQSTYLEWLNSAFQNEAEPWGDTPRTCQNCHMPQTFRDEPLAFRIANIEDDTFPPMRYQLPEPELSLPVREPFSRHTLVGINLFSLEMFRQFIDKASGNNEILGIRTVDPMQVYGGEIVNPLDNTVESSLDLAQGDTARVEILAVTRDSATLTTRVRVTNLAGHHFPSGVGFRRAFLELRILNSEGTTLWVSGATDDLGIILGADGKPLPTEFFAEIDGEQSFQPHWQVIERPDQVQIYEELAKSPPPESRFTTSFLSLYQRVKDNRLQPRGWQKDGPWAEITQPDGDAEEDCLYTVDAAADCAPWYAEPSTGADELTYRVPLTALPGWPAAVSVTLYYQSLPPYYQADRYGLLAKCANPADPSCYPETRRLLYLASRLDTNVEIAGQRPIAGWKLKVGSVTRRLTAEAPRSAR